MSRLSMSLILCVAVLGVMLVAIEARRGGRGGRWGRQHIPCYAQDVNGTVLFDLPCDFSSEDPNEPSLYNCSEPQPSSCGGRGGRWGRHDSSEEQDEHQALLVSYCYPSNCESDADCLGDSVCTGRFQQCSVSRDQTKYAAACLVVDVENVPVKSRPCIKDNETCDLERPDEIQIEGETLTAYKCRRDCRHSGEDDSDVTTTTTTASPGDFEP